MGWVFCDVLCAAGCLSAMSSLGGGAIRVFIGSARVDWELSMRGIWPSSGKIRCNDA